jgi:hypothetical protein
MCKKLSEDMNFKNFKLIYQDRFDESNSNGNLKKFTGDLLQFEKYGLLIKHTSQNLKKIIPTNLISCHSQNIGWVSFYADGTVWPCCWLMGWHRTNSSLGKIVQQHMFKILEIDLSEISLYNHTLQNIIEGKVWQEMYPKSFNHKPNPICLQQCSNKK